MQPAASASTAGEWSHVLSSPQVYLAGKVQLWVVPSFLADLSAAEHSVASMAWEELCAQPTTVPGGLQHFVEHGTARFVYVAAAGVVVARGAQPVLTQ